MDFFDCKTADQRLSKPDELNRLENHLVKNCVVLNSVSDSETSLEKIRCKSCGIVWSVTYQYDKHGMRYANKL